jgi:tryptophan synthase alpha chain
MKRLTHVFQDRPDKALVGYLTLGYPDLEASLETARILSDNGADIIELGIPFSDPLADGATIQHASFHALQQGITPAICLEAAARIRKFTEVPLLFMTYFNPVWRYGPADFARDAAAAGVDGLIVPDLPPDEGGELEAACRDHGLDLVYLAAPNSTDTRLRQVAEHASGFIYLVSVTGVTGARAAAPPDVGGLVARLRAVTDKPVCVGFGISGPEQVRAVAAHADGVIVGSQIVKLSETAAGRRELPAFIASLKAATWPGD